MAGAALRGRGVSLLETLIAFGILAGVMLALFNLAPASMMAIRQANDRVQAGNLAQDLLNQARTQFPPANLVYSPVTIDSTTFTPTVAVSPVPGNDPARLLEVQVTIQWDFQSRHQVLTQELRTCVVNVRPQ